VYFNYDVFKHKLESAHGLESCTCTCVVMSGEAGALNAHIFLPKLVKSVLEGVGRRCIHDVLWKSIPVHQHSLAVEHSMNYSFAEPVSICVLSDRVCIV